MAEHTRDQPYPRLTSTLHIADSLTWRQQRHYNPDLAGALQNAYASLHAAREQHDAYFHAYAALIPFRAKRMCAEQRLRLEYALALAYAGEHAAPQALGALERALEAADELDDVVAPVELAYLAGALAHGLQQHELAFGQYTEALDALRRLAHEGRAADPQLEVDLTLRLGWRACEIGRFPQALRYLDEAYALRARWPATNPSHAAWLSWLDAHLAYVRGNPQRALAMAQPAAALLLEIGQPLNAGRAAAFVAECAIELAQTPAGDDPRRALAIAHDAIRRAKALAREAHDAIGGHIAQLAALQFERVAWRRLGTTDGANQLPALERTLRRASTLHDMALIGRVETAMGDVLVAQEDWERARLLYLRARLHLEEHNLGGLAFWPRRAVRHIEGK